MSTTGSEKFTKSIQTFLGPIPLKESLLPEDGPVLSNLHIESEINKGNIVIHPFNSSQLGNCSYDITLGSNFYRAKTFGPGLNPVVNPTVAKDLHNYWELKTAGEVITLHDGETILCHSQEVIGGRRNITTMLKARSTMMRAGLSIAGGAGWGDIGYVNRWAFSITNNSNAVIVLPVGMKIAQIVFLRTGETKSSYSGDYNATALDPKKILEEWKPESMLPRLN